MATRPIVLYDNVLGVEYGRIYWSSSAAAFYTDADCTHETTTVPKPTKQQYRFDGYTSGTGSGTTKYIDANGNILDAFHPSGTSTTEFKVYAQFTKISIAFVLAPASSSTIAWTIPTNTLYRSVASGGDAYLDDQLTDGPITSIPIPYAEKNAFNGAGTSSSSKYIDDFGNITNLFYNYTPGSTTTTVNLTVYGSLCRSCTLDANGGSGGEGNPIWWNVRRSTWTRDITLLSDITKVNKPHRNGYIFDGYWTTATAGTQVIDEDGNLLAGFTTTSDIVRYAHWKSPTTITLNNDGGTGLTALYYGAGSFYDNATVQTPVTKITPPTRANHRFLGYFEGSTERVDATGAIAAGWSPSSATTLTAHWERVSYTVNIALNGGTGPSRIYVDAARTAFFDTEACDGAAITGISVSRAGYLFLGAFTSDDETSTKIVDTAGNFTQAADAFRQSVTDGATIYARWRLVFTVTLNPNGGVSPVAEIYYDEASGLWYDDERMTTPVTAIAIPALECYKFGGYELGGTVVIEADGTISQSWTPTGNCTIVATWTRFSYKYTLDPNGGATEQAAIYNDGVDGAAWYADDQLTERATTVTLPVFPGYTFAGYHWNGYETIDATGLIKATQPITADRTTVAQWTANTYTLTFDYNGGTGAVESKRVTFGQPIGELPSATRPRANFIGWKINGEAVTASSNYEVPGDGVAIVNWDLQFGGVEDYFVLASSGLVPISSDSGDDKKRICCSHIGKYEPNVNDISGTWRNPTVTYAVVRNTTVAVTLGRAFRGSGTISGYMIVGVTITTQVGQFPTVTVEAVANEGVDAINKFNLSVAVIARSKAQNLMGAVSGGGRLNACTLSAHCEPVVVEEHMMPVASDVVNGQIDITATTIATEREAAPTASGGFTSIGEPKAGMESAYTTYTLNAQKEMT